MSQKIEVVADRDTMIQYRGEHKGVRYLIQQHSFQEDSSILCKSTWCTYVTLTDEQHDKFKDRINGAPWNGGQTFYQRVVQVPVDCPSPELRDKYSRPFYKIGDDFNHLWDQDRQDRFSRKYMEWHVKRVIDFLLAEPEPEAE